MRILDAGRLEAIETATFTQADPFPWVNPEGVLREEAFAYLRAHLPPVELFDRIFGKARAHGQKPHDRFALEYRPDLPVDPAWHALVDELRGPTYMGFLERLFGTNSLWLSFHWHYTPTGCSVSPHCDAPRKAGSQIFYFNTEEDWRREWGGDTRLLDDQGKLSRRTAPDFDDFVREIPAETLGNRSLLFERTPHSWHGVRPLTSPEGEIRKVFIVVINRMRAVDRARRAFGLPLAAGY